MDIGVLLTIIGWLVGALIQAVTLACLIIITWSLWRLAHAPRPHPRKRR